jgi:hypothetical protein
MKSRRHKPPGDLEAQGIRLSREDFAIVTPNKIASAINWKTFLSRSFELDGRELAEMYLLLATHWLTRRNINCGRSQSLRPARAAEPQAKQRNGYAYGFELPLRS